MSNNKTVLEKLISDYDIKINNKDFYVVVLDDILVDNCIWGYYYKNEPLHTMNMYISEEDYDNLQNNYFSFITDKNIINTLMLCTDSASQIEEYLLGYHDNILSIGKVKQDTKENISKHTKEIGRTNLSGMLILDNKKDLSKFKLCYRYSYIVLPVSL